ncbi:unnamed protein product, partial [Iphiclides podalirius]
MTVVHATWVLTIAYTALGIPINNGPVKEALPVMDQVDLRDKRSGYGGLHVSPCAAASSPVPSFAPASAYQFNMAPAQYHRPYNPYNYNAHHYNNYPHYRTEHDENELLSFSDMNHIGSDNVPVGIEGLNLPYNYPGDLRTAILNSPLAPVQGLPSFGAFPYSNPNALSMPFLFSCSPSIVPGQMVHAQPQYYTGYRVSDVPGEVDIQSLLEPQEHQQSPQPERPVAPQKTNNVETTTQ